MTIENKTAAVFTAWNAVIADMAKDGVDKVRKNQAQGYQFRGIDDVLNALAASYARNGLAVVCRYGDMTSAVVATAKGGQQTHVTIRAAYTLVSTRDGSTFDAGTFVGEAFDSGDKAIGKAQSYAYKFFAIQTFAIPTAGDNDTENHSHERVGAASAPRRDTPRNPDYSKPVSREDMTRPSHGPVREEPRITKGPASGKLMRDATDDELRAFASHVQGVLDNPAMVAHRDGAIKVLNQIDAELVGRRE